MERLKISELGKYNDKRHRLLPDVRLMKDPLLTIVNQYITIDIQALGKELYRLYPEEWRSMSMCEIIERHYGHEAAEFVEALI